MSEESNHMESWAVEKASNVTACLSRARDILAKSDGPFEDKLEHADCLLGAAIYDASKILSYVAKVEWSTEDARDIQCHGHEGYERIAVKYGIIHRTQVQIQHSTIAEFIEALSKLLGGDRSPNRTFVHELLNETTLKHPLVEKTTRIVELVTQGQLEWKDFVLIMDSEIRELKPK